MVRQTLNLHLVPDTVKPVIYLEQYDNDLVQLVFNLIGTNNYYTIPSGTIVTLEGRKPDRTAFSYACTWSGHTVTLNVTDQLTAVAGTVKALLRFTNSSGTTILSSIAMDIVINRSPLDGMTCSKNDFVSVEKTLLGARSDAIAAQQYAIQAGASATDASETASTAVANINAAKNTAVSTINSAQTTGVNAVNSAKTAAVGAITSAQTTGVDAVNSAKTTGVSELNSIKTSAVNTINSKGDEVKEVFENCAAEMRTYVEYPNDTIYEYITASESLRITTLVPASGS